MAGLSEAQLVAQIKDFLEYRCWRPLRMQRTVVPGSFQSGEPGIADYLFIYYDPDAARNESGAVPWSLTLWIEFKRPGDRRRCKCLQNAGTRKRCTVCDQAAWKQREKARGGVVWTVSGLEAFERLYWDRFGFLHKGESARGQMAL